MNQKLTKYAWLLPFISGICWGAAGIFVRTLEHDGLDNFSIISFRMLLAALITGIWILVFYNISVTKGSLALSAVLLAMSPVFVLFLAAIFFHEPITRHKLTCVTLALIGCVLVSGVLESNGLSWSITGILCGILASFFYAVYGIISKKVTQKGYHFLTITFYGTLFSGMTMLPFSNIHSLSSMIVSGQRTTFFILIIHALVSSVLPYALYSLSMRYMEAGKASILASSEPAAAMLFGAVLYAETPGILSICGLCFTITAVILLNYERN
jgi:drug/metabolite transporter (DMT)-like permease